MEISTAERVLPCILSPPSPTFKSKPRRLTPSPQPLRFNTLYRELVLENKLFLRTNRYARQNSPVRVLRHLTPSPKLEPDLKPRTRVGLGVAGLPALLRFQQKPLLRTMLDCYRLDQSWVQRSPKGHKRTASRPKSLPRLRPAIERSRGEKGVRTEEVQYVLEGQLKRCKKQTLLQTYLLTP